MRMSSGANSEMAVPFPEGGANNSCPVTNTHLHPLKIKRGRPLGRQNVAFQFERRVGFGWMLVRRCQSETCFNITHGGGKKGILSPDKSPFSSADMFTLHSPFLILSESLS